MSLLPQTEIDPYTGLPVPRVDPTMGMPAPAAAPSPGLLGKLGNAFGGSQGLLTLGANLMAAGGPSPVRTSFGQALGPALLATQQQKTQTEKDMLQAMLLKTKIAAAGAGKNTQPSDVKSYEYAKANGFEGSFADWKRIAAAQPQTPAAIQEWQAFQKLTPEEQQKWIDFKRNSQPYQVVDIGGGKQLLNKSQGTLKGVTTAEQEASGAGQIAEAQAGGRTTGETVATAKLDLPRVETNADYAIDLLDRIKKHPGLDYGVGLWSKAPVVPGTKQADFVALTEQLQGRQFLEAYASLKGGGQISEIEGAKAENAIARMQRAQSKQAFVEAATEFQGIIRKGVENARRKAEGGPSAPSAPKRVRVDAEGNVIGD